MLYPSIDKMLKKVESKYSLVVATAKRARKLKDGTTVLIEKPQSNKYVGMALEEFYNDKLVVEKNRNNNL